MSEDLVLVLTDVVDSTQLNDRLGDAAMAPLWGMHDRSARQLIQHWRGREVGRSDGFLLLFAVAADAVGFALDYQRMLAALTVPLKARVGVHVGPVRLRQNTPHDIAQGATPFEVDGIALPAAARVMAAAGGGQTLLSAPARQALGETPLRLVSHGHWRLKGLAEPIELFEIGDEQAPLAPPADSAKAYRVVRNDGLWLPARELPHNLPAERDAFVGRSEALRALADAFDNGARLVTLLGMGGIGKTRLSQRYARSWLGDHPGGAWFCDLSPARSADGVAHAVAQGLNVPLGRADPVQQLGAAIAGRGPCLVILDNFEQVAAHAEGTLGAWLERAPEARFIATSREVLGIVGEQVQVLAPLQPDEAVTMFRKRVHAAGVASEFGADDESAVLPLIELLDRLPLAIEFAAARSRLMTPRVLLQRMADRFQLLATRSGRRDRQATLRAALDWSWNLLSAAEQSALAQLSVFEGGFTLEAAEAVLDLAHFRLAPQTVNVVQALVEKSLVREREGTRFDLLGTVRDYAAEQLKQWPVNDQSPALALARHGEFFAGLWDRTTAAEACADLDNLVLAARRAAGADQAEVAVGSLLGVWSALKLRGPFRAISELAQVVHAMPGVPVGLAARVDWVDGWALKACGRVAEAEHHLTSALSLARSAGDLRCSGNALVQLGELHANAGRMDVGRDELQAALALAGQVADLALECDAHNGLGNLHRHRGELDLARAHYEATRAAARRMGSRRWEGGSLGNLGNLFIDQGRSDEALGCLEQALTIAREVGDRQFEGNTLCNLGLLHQMQGKLEVAATELQAALQVARELGHVRLECTVLCNLGIVTEAMRSPTTARAYYEAACRIARDLRDRRLEGQVLGYLGVLHARAGRPDDARVCLESGECHLLAVADRLSLALLYCARAESEMLAGAVEAAQRKIALAQALASEVGAQPGSEVQVWIERLSGHLEPAAP